MLEVKFYKGEEDNVYGLTMEGHCNYAEKGNDIVCSAATILVKALQVVLECNAQTMCEYVPHISLEEGYAMVMWKPKKAKKHKNTLLTSLITVEQGFRVLAHNYPNNITIL